MRSKHIVITGASGAVGRSLALAYATPGVFLSLFGRSEKALNEVASACRQLGAVVVNHCVDVLDTDALMAKLAGIDDENPVDLLIANAGIVTYLDAQVTLESWEDAKETIAVNLVGAMATANALIPSMRRRKGGQIAFVSSVAAYHGLVICPSYCASKSGLKAYGEALRLLLKKDNIQVSVICPGFIESAMSQKYHARKYGVLKPDVAAFKIKKGLSQNKANITFPFFLGLGLRMLGILPAPVSAFFLNCFQ